MRRICVVDDTPGKRDDLCQYASAAFPEATIDVFDVANEFLKFACQDNVSEILTNPEDWFFIVDTNMPHEHGDPRHIDTRCGFFILRRLQQHGLCCPVILTSSESVDDSEAEQTYDAYAGSISYTPWHVWTSDIRRLWEEFVAKKEEKND